MKFVPFVKPRTDMKRAARWVYLVGRSDFTVQNIQKHTVVCERHFPENIELDWKKNPALEPFPSSLQMETMPPHEKSEASGTKSDTKIEIDLESVNKLPKITENLFPTQVVKVYNKKTNIKTVAIPVPHGISIQNAPKDEIDFKGIFSFNKCFFPFSLGI